jgi:phage terminase small subunit
VKKKPAAKRKVATKKKPRKKIEKLDEHGLTLKQREIADLYRGGGDALRGNAKLCYWAIHPRAKESTAETEGPKIIRKPQIQAYLKVKSQEIAEKCDIDAAWILRQSIAVHERCMQTKPVLDRKGDPVMVTIESPDGEDVEMVPAFTFDAAGANKALELAGKNVNVQAFEKDTVAVGLTIVLTDKDSQA